MTNEQKEQIKKLRGQGLGYKKVADLLSLSENTVKSFCKRTGLGGVVGTRKAEVTEDHFCKCCGLPVLQQANLKEKLFCSDDCRMGWQKMHMDQVQHKVVYN